jgi:tRNA1(Val) A37 N6-methylase TrmN6
MFDSVGGIYMSRQAQKHAGAYYTPDAVVATLLRWAVRSNDDRMLDPSCGDGRFIAGHRNSVGIEQDSNAAYRAIARAPWALVHEGDFFTWATNTTERFECAAGNPPFIRYQTFKGAMRERALGLSQGIGAPFTGLTSSWAPFLAITASLLKPGGRMAFVVPAEIGHAPYAAPLLEYLTSNFDIVHVTAVKRKLFPDLNEDCWLLYTEGFGGRTASIRFSVIETLKALARPPRAYQSISVVEWRSIWNRRLRPFVMPKATRELYQLVAEDLFSKRLRDIAQVGIGYVSGANDFFHLRPSTAAKFSIPSQLLHATVRNGRALPSKQVSQATVKSWLRNDEPAFLLKLPKTIELPSTVKRYLDTSEGIEAREAYKCRVRSPWYSVPDVQVPDFFLTYMSGYTASLVRNRAGATCTNSVHCVRVRDKSQIEGLRALWDTSFVQLSCEIEGHPLGGGMLKLEPREASQILFPSADLLSTLDADIIEEGLSEMRSWRHYAS